MQGRFKRDGSAAGDPERAQESGPTAAVREGGGGAGPEYPTTDPSGGGEAATANAAAAASGPGSRAALRNWRISTRLVSLLALPVVAATTLGALRIQDSLSNVDQLDNMKQLTEMTEKATQLAAALQEERDRSAGPLVGTGNDKDDTVVAPREKADQSIAAFKAQTARIDSDDKVMKGVQSTVLDITRQLTQIRDIRERAYDNPSYVSQTVNSYNTLIESLLSLSQDMAQATSNSEMIQSTRALTSFSTAKEYASIQRAIISAGLAHKGGPSLSESDRLYAKTASESEHASLGSFSKIYGEEQAAQLTKPLDGGLPNITAADKYRDRVLQNADGIKRENRSYMDWYDQDRTKIDEMGKIESTLLSQMEQQARELRSEAQAGAFLNGAVILLVLGISLVGAFVVARSMVRSLRRLQDTAQDVARKRLPELVKQMSEAEPQDVDTSVESVGVHSRDEIGRVAAAFDDVHREAVRLAGEQALLRGNVNAMFTNLSRRSQGLIQRQLSLISELESREADPDQLSSLFKLDHLATRMRRNGENLLVLAGEEPGRRWTRPVPLVDVLRAAASEVEQYERIELSSVPTTEVTGRVVNDLVHLLAELLENATSFSSPQTKVKVTGHALPDGRVLVEIHDTGIGLSPEDLSSINERLANPPTVDVSVSRRMGLFVVGRLSLRHGIRIQLRPSDSGGTTALVMLPVDVAQGGAAKNKPGAAGQGGNGAQGGQGGSAKSAPAGSRLAGLTPRGQVSGGQRGALPGGAPAGAGAPGGGSGAPTTDFFGGGTARPGGANPPSPAPPRPSAPGEAPAPAGSDANRPPLPARGPAGELTGGPAQGGPAGPSGPAQIGTGSPGSGATGEFPQPQGDFSRTQAEGPADTGEFARPAPEGRQPSGGPGDTAEFARPDFDAPPPAAPGAGAGTGQDSGRREPAGWRDGIPETQFPRPEIKGTDPASEPPSSDDTSSQVPLPRPSWVDGPAAASGPAEDAPRGHEEPEGTGEYPQPGFTAASSGGGGAEAARPGQQQGAEAVHPAADELRQALREDRGPSALVPGGPEEQPQDPAAQEPGARDAAGQEQAAPEQPQAPQDTGEFAAPGAGAAESPLTDPNFQIPAGPQGGEPIFASMESNWFRGAEGHPQQGGGQGAQGQGFEQTGYEQQAGYGQGLEQGGYEGARYEQPAQTAEFGRTDGFGQNGYQEPGAGAAGAGTEHTHGVPPQDAPTARPGQAASAVPPMPQRRPSGGAAGDQGADTGAHWGASPNDETWRRAEQVRQPAAGGVTTSGLPRRVPRANLVAGTAQQQSSAQSGPQVSRAPDDVRGRLTNLRRGIQQGRQAGSTDGRGMGPTHQQER
ncbi:nitrate- and nitrite sensing domain-containing protein [Streptomyces sp. ODS28]|uniref:sensor histidine kinase n=1 Tax=Streptomyces sp. ODS28 TaxID=3136688 RepID=UPI0031F05B60